MQSQLDLAAKGEKVNSDSEYIHSPLRGGDDGASESSSPLYERYQSFTPSLASPNYMHMSHHLRHRPLRLRPSSAPVRRPWRGCLANVCASPSPESAIVQANLAADILMQFIFVVFHARPFRTLKRFSDSRRSALSVQPRAAFARAVPQDFNRFYQ
eukprot:6199867-Pleurochrysis_carterae.AAC.2